MPLADSISHSRHHDQHKGDCEEANEHADQKGNEEEQHDYPRWRTRGFNTPRTRSRARTVANNSRGSQHRQSNYAEICGELSPPVKRLLLQSNNNRAMNRHSRPCHAPGEPKPVEEPMHSGTNGQARAICGSNSAHTSLCRHASDIYWVGHHDSIDQIP